MLSLRIWVTYRVYLPLDIFVGWHLCLLSIRDLNFKELVTSMLVTDARDSLYRWSLVKFKMLMTDFGGIFHIEKVIIQNHEPEVVLLG